jgi:hypothetical protein
MGYVRLLDNTADLPQMLQVKPASENALDRTGSTDSNELSASGTR